MAVDALVDALLLNSAIEVLPVRAVWTAPTLALTLMGFQATPTLALTLMGLRAIPGVCHRVNCVGFQALQVRMGRLLERCGDRERQLRGELAVCGSTQWKALCTCRPFFGVDSVECS